MNFEEIDDSHLRAKVFGGWIVKNYEDVCHIDACGYDQRGWDWRVAMVFVPDPNHEWVISEENASEQ